MKKRTPGRPAKYDLDHIMEAVNKGFSRDEITQAFKINHNTLKSRICDIKHGRRKRHKHIVTVWLDDEVFQRLNKRNLSQSINRELVNSFRNKEAL